MKNIRLVSGKRVNLRVLMNYAHIVARRLEGHYYARISEGIKDAWKLAKQQLKEKLETTKEKVSMTREMVVKIASGFDTYKAFRKSNRKAYKAAKQLSITEEVKLMFA